MTSMQSETCPKKEEGRKGKYVKTSMQFEMNSGGLLLSTIEYMELRNHHVQSSAEGCMSLFKLQDMSHAVPSCRYYSMWC
jgi:hypothetical protein